MDQQEVTLGEMMGNCQSQKAKVLAVTSGKGGVGKTNIAANLAICLAASGKKVVLIDADLGLGNLDIIMNITSRYNLWHVACGQKSLTDIINTAQAGVEVICGGSGLEEMANLSRFQRQRLLEEMDKLQDHCDIIIIDTSAGINNSVLGFCMAADQVLIATTPEPSAMTDAYAMMKVLAGQRFDGRVCLTVNQADSAVEGKKIYRQLADVAKRFLDIDVYDAGFVYRDEKVPASVKTRQPVVLSAPRSKATASIVAMAARISKGTVVNAQKSEGFFKKVVNWFF